jgi:16S rRNA (guanine966-N2)-methyltransferase
MRIITGKYKGRHFEIPRSFKARPTTDFAKENIFNVIRAYVDFENTQALDLFAGTGGISLELLSRGAQSVVSVEQNREHAAFISSCLKKIGEEHCILIRGDVFRFLKKCRQQYNLIFADPPYALENLSVIPDIVFEHELLSAEGILVLEHGSDYDFSQHPHFMEHRTYGSVNFTVFR